MGTNNCVMVLKDESDRILITYEAASENADDALAFLQNIKNCGMTVTSAFSDYSDSYVKAIREVFPDAKFQADHFHTAKNIWKHLKKSLLEYRRNLKAEGEKNKDEDMLEIASELWKMRWVLLKKPSNLTENEREKIEALEKIDSGFISTFRSIIDQIVNIFDHSNTDTQAKIKLKNLKNQIEKLESSYLGKITKFFSDHWDAAMQYLKKKGLAKYRRSSNSESGMRLLRRLEKNHDGIRSVETRKHYIKIYQAIKYLSADVTEFINSGTEKIYIMDM
ncbi:transposase [uncultured Desulfobacter sp.]|uniref:transposase n=1 Tax=uncultured Desulfobacter sp. TaxID=240139 RepID=UPI002AABBCF8|nr:transposase [uncultured Desulfobacter sp.]